MNRVAFVACFCLLTANRVAAQPADADDRVVRAEAPIVAGNAVTAKKRALADAFRQAVERAFTELVNESQGQGAVMSGPLPVAVAQLKASLANNAQKFIRSYRLIEQTTEGGMLKVMVESDVDAVLLRRELERVRGAATNMPAAAPAAVPAASLVLVAAPGPVAAVLINGLRAGGLKAQPDPSTTEAQLASAAAAQNAYGLFVATRATSEGVVRGTGAFSIKCSLRSRLFRPGPQGRPARAPNNDANDRNDEDRGFAADEAGARAACFARVASTHARGVASTLRAPAVGAPFVTLQLDVAEPGAVLILLHALRRLGAVTASEVRLVSATTADIRVFTRIGGPALQRVLVREVGPKLALVPTQSSPDRLAMQVRNVDSSAVEEPKNPGEVK